MKHFAKFIIFQVLVIVIMAAVLAVLAFRYNPVEIDTVDLNDYVQTVKENWGNPDAIRNAGLTKDILVFDKSNKVTYSSSDRVFGEIRSPYDALAKDMIAMPVTDGEVYLGTLIIQDSAKIEYEYAMHRIIVVLIAGAVLLLLSYVAFLWYVDRKIIKPFDRLKKYAGIIATGRLDEPLIMERSNIFGEFTESFDIMREELQASRERETALKMKEKEIVASLSHDLKTPVTGIKVMCEMMEVKVEDEYIRQKIKKISSRTMEINTLLDDLLSTALDDLGELKAECRVVSSGILRELVEQQDSRKLVRAGEIPECLLNIDTKRFSQVIGNILTNSYKYANTEIEVTYTFHDRYLEMTIRDRGEGVDDEELDFLTKKFFRGKKNTADKEGSGLGLYISNELMTLMNGQLICRNDEEGFEVILRCPLA